MKSILYRRTDEDPIDIVRGIDHRLHTRDGRTLFDLSSGPCASSLGHSNAMVLKAMEEQAWQIPWAFSGFFTTRIAEQAAELLAAEFEKLNPGWFGRVIFQNGGGEAVDLTCKLAAQFHLEAGTYRYRFLSREHSFHGVGLLPFCLSGDYPRYQLIEPYDTNVYNYYVDHIPHPAVVGEEQSLRLFRSSTKQVAACIIEPVSGPPIGAFPDSPNYLRALRSICNDAGALLIYDEILCGAGRCGPLSVAAYGAASAWPDIIILGKGLTGGYQPMSAICLSRRVVDRIDHGSKTIMFGTTFSAHTMGCAAIVGTLRYLDANNLYEYVASKGPQLQALLEHKLVGPMVNEVRGKGFLWGIGLTQPNGNYWPAKVEFHAKARKAILDRDIVVYSKGQTVHGERDYLIIAPPFEMPWGDLEMAVEQVAKGIQDAYTYETRSADSTA